MSSLEDGDSTAKFQAEVGKGDGMEAGSCCGKAWIQVGDPSPRFLLCLFGSLHATNVKKKVLG